MFKQTVLTTSLIIAAGSAFALTDNNASVDSMAGEVSTAATPIILAQNEAKVSDGEKAKRSKEVEKDAKSAADKAKANSAMPEKSDPTASAALPKGESKAKASDDKKKSE